MGDRTAVIGVSKTLPLELPAHFHVMGEEEALAIAVTCAGIDLASAKARLRAKHCRKRLPPAETGSATGEESALKAGPVNRQPLRLNSAEAGLSQATGAEG